MSHSKIIIFIFLILNVQTASSQVNKDSLRGVWNDVSRPDTIRLNAMHDFAWHGYLFSQPDSAFYFAQQEYDFAKSKGLKKQMGRALHTQGVSFWVQSDYTSALKYYSRVLTINEEIGYKKGIASALNNIGLVFKVQSNYENAIINYTRSLNIYEDIGDKKGMGITLNNIGIIYMEQGDHDNAIDYYTRSLTIKEAIGDKKGMAFALNKIGLIYYEQGDHANAIINHTRSLTINEAIGDKRGMAASLNNIGLIYMEQGDHDNAIDYYTRSLTINEEIGDKKGMAFTLNNIGIIYIEQGDHDNAIDYYTRCLIIGEEIGDKKGIALALNNIGLIYRYQGDYVNAMEYDNRSLSIREEIGDKKGMANSLNNIGYIYLEQGDSAYVAGNVALSADKYASATTYSTHALKLAQEAGAALESRKAANALYKIHQAKGRYKQALEMYKLYIATKDSIDSEENIREVLRQEYKYVYDKQAIVDSVAFAKEQNIKDALIQVSDVKLEKAKVQQYALYGGVTLLLVFLTYIYNRYRVTHRQGLIITKQNNDIKLAMEKLQEKALRLQMNPHFIFNTLNSMQSIMILKGEREANKFFGFFSKLIRFTLDMSNSDHILLKDEIAYLKSYLSLEKMRLNGELDISFDIDSNLDIENVKIPCMLFQPIIENAIIHGLKPKKNNRKLKLSLNKKGGILKGYVIDNGIGREAANIKNQYRKNHISWATHIMNERMKILNSQKNKKISFKIIDLKENNKPIGTKVRFLIPINE